MESVREEREVGRERENEKETCRYTYSGRMEREREMKIYDI